MCTAQDVHILHKHMRNILISSLCATYSISSQSITLQIIKLKHCYFEVIRNPHVTRNCSLAKICGRTLTKRGDVRSTQSGANSWWCVPTTCTRPACRAGCAFACTENRCIVTKEMHYMWCKMRATTRNAAMPRNRLLLLCKVRAP